MCLSCTILARAGPKTGIVRAPVLSPLSPAGAGVPLHSPLDAESQYNSIVTLQGLLALVCGTGIPHLTGNTSQQRVTCQQTEQLGTRAGCQQSHKSTEMRKQAVTWAPAFRVPRQR